MDPQNDAVKQIKEQLRMIEDKSVPAYDGFKQISFIADVYMIGDELCVAAPDDIQISQQDFKDV